MKPEYKNVFRRPYRSLTKGLISAPKRLKRLMLPTKMLSWAEERDCDSNGVTSEVMPMSYPKLQLFKEATAIVIFSCLLRLLMLVDEPVGGEDSDGDRRYIVSLLGSQFPRPCWEYRSLR